MADSTITFSTWGRGFPRDFQAGIFAVTGTHTYGVTMSASQIYFAIPIPDAVTVVDGYVKSSHNASYSFLASVGWNDARSLIMAATTIASVPVRFDGVPHDVTITDSDTWPRHKPLVVAIHAAASGTLNGVMTVVAFLQKL